jgi:hypothetical protein
LRKKLTPTRSNRVKSDVLRYKDLPWYEPVKSLFFCQLVLIRQFALVESSKRNLLVTRVEHWNSIFWPFATRRTATHGNDSNMDFGSKTGSHTSYRKKISVNLNFENEWMKTSLTVSNIDLLVSKPINRPAGHDSNKHPKLRGFIFYFFEVVAFTC